jgi:hypothetical protein
VTVEDFECPVTEAPDLAASTPAPQQEHREAVVTPECSCVRVTTTVEEFED